jgi:hypothetical protein
MADLVGSMQVPESAEDIDMGAGEEAVEDADEGAAGEDPEETVVAADPAEAFWTYLRSPVVKLNIGSGDEQTILSAHRAILERSPYFMSKLATLASNSLSL